MEFIEISVDTSSAICHASPKPLMQTPPMTPRPSSPFQIRLWHYPETTRPPVVVETRHQANLFGVRFLPCTNNLQLVSGAMDYTVQACAALSPEPNRIAINCLLDCNTIGVYQNTAILFNNSVVHQLYLYINCALNTSMVCILSGFQRRQRCGFHSLQLLSVIEVLP